jgi:hypothetical protein
VKQWVDDKTNGALKGYVDYVKELFPDYPEFTDDELDEIHKSLVEAARTTILRNWLHIRKRLVIYFIKSPERPFGLPVRKMFYRDEYQSDEGNLPHGHALVELQGSYDNKDDRPIIQDLVRGFVQDIIRDEEIPDLVRRESFLPSLTGTLSLTLGERSYLTHTAHGANDEQDPVRMTLAAAFLTTED